MVIANNWKQINKSRFWDFAGISLINMSIGISISIAKSNNFVFGNSSANFTIARTANELSKNLEKLEELNDKIPQKDREKKELVFEILNELKISKENLMNESREN